MTTPQHRVLTIGRVGWGEVESTIIRGIRRVNYSSGVWVIGRAVWPQRRTLSPCHECIVDRAAGGRDNVCYRANGSTISARLNVLAQQLARCVAGFPLCADPMCESRFGIVRTVNVEKRKEQPNGSNANDPEPNVPTHKATCGVFEAPPRAVDRSLIQVCIAERGARGWT